MSAWDRRRNEIAFPTFVIQIRQVSRETATIAYVEGQRERLFSAERFGPDWKNLDVLIDRTVPSEDVPRIVANLREGLDRLGYGHSIRRELPSTRVTEARQRAAAEKLRSMGMEPRPAKGGVPEHWVGGADTLSLPDVADLVADARGFRRNYELLSRNLLGSENEPP